jgi:hypothetical protein
MQSLYSIQKISAAFIVCGAVLLAPVDANASSIYDSGYAGKIEMTGSQKAKVKRISAATRAERRQIFRKYGISEKAQPDMSKLMKASNELQAMNRNERNELAKVFTPTQLQQYDALVRQVRERVVKAAK